MSGLVDIFRTSSLGLIVEQLGLNFMDVGARGGLDAGFLPAAWATTAIGFEPDPDECMLLNSNNPAPWRSLRYHPVAIAGTDGDCPLHVPSNGEGASLLKHRPEMLEMFGYDALHGVSREVRVEALTIDSAIKRFAVAFPDYLKIDVEGAELLILRAAPRALERCSAVKVEVSFLEQRLNQPLMHEVVSFMMGLGFSVAEVSGVHVWRRRPLPAHPFSGRWIVPYSKGVVAQCDVLFLRSPPSLTDPELAVRLFSVSSILGYFDHAVATLRTFPALESMVIGITGGDPLIALGKLSRRFGRAAAFAEIGARVRSLFPLFRSATSGIPIAGPVRPGY